MVSIASNPFLATLMLNYFKENELTFPKNQAELYGDYLSRRFDESEEELIEKGLTKNFIEEYASDLSYFLFASEHHGLEIQISQLVTELPQFSALKHQQCIEVLAFAKIGRLSPDKRFSFVHRRFHEYL